MATAYNWGNEPPDPRTDPVELNPPPQEDQLRDTEGVEAPTKQPQRPRPAAVPQRPASTPSPFRKPAKPSPEEEMANMLLFMQAKALGFHIICNAIQYLSRETKSTTEANAELSRFMLCTYNDLLAWGVRYGARPTVTVDEAFTDENLYGGQWLEFLQAQAEELEQCLIWVCSNPLSTPGLKHWTTTTLSHIEMVMMGM